MNLLGLALLSTAIAATSYGQKTSSPISDTVSTAATQVTVDESTIESWTMPQPATMKAVPNARIALSDFPCAFGGSRGCSQPAAASKPQITPRTLVVVHVVFSTAQPSPLHVGASDWYVYKDVGSNLVTQTDKGSVRSLFDVTDLVLITISELQKDRCDRALAPPSVHDTPTAIQKEKQSSLDLKTLLSGLSGVSMASAGLVPDKSTCNRGTLENAFWVTVQTASAKPKISIPFDWQIHSSVLGPDNGSDASGDCSDLEPVSSCTFSRTFSVIERQYFDFGAGIYPHGPRQNFYAASSGIVAQSHTVHAGFMGTFDIKPFRGGDPQKWAPYAQVGLPLKGSALRFPYVGAAAPLHFTDKILPMSGFVGVFFMRQQLPRTLSIGQTATSDQLAADLRTDWPAKLAWGVGVPLSKITSKISSNFGK